MYPQSLPKSEITQSLIGRQFVGTLFGETYLYTLKTETNTSVVEDFPRGYAVVTENVLVAEGVCIDSDNMSPFGKVKTAKLIYLYLDEFCSLFGLPYYADGSCPKIQSRYSLPVGNQNAQ